MLRKLLIWLAIAALSAQAPFACAIHARGAGTPQNGFFPASHWVAAVLPMTVIFPQPDSSTKSYARQHWAFWDGTHAVKDIIPIEVKGGALPYVYTLLSGPPGASIEQPYWIAGDNAQQMQAVGYGYFVWTPQGNISSTWTGTVSVLVTGQDLNTITVSFTLSTVGAYSTSSVAGNVTTNGTTVVTLNSGGPYTYGTVISGLSDIPTGDYVVGVSGSSYTLAQSTTGSQTGTVTGTLKAGFLFDDAALGNDSTGTGSITAPWQTLTKVYTTVSCVSNPSGCSSNPGAILYLRGNNSSTDYEVCDQGATTGITCGSGTHPGITLSGANNPIDILGFPGDPTPDLDITNLVAAPSAKSIALFLYDDAADAFIQGIQFSGEADGGSGTGPANFSYIFDTYGNSRLTFDSIFVPNAWPGSSMASGNSSTIDLENPGSGGTRSYIVLRNIVDQNRPGAYDGIGIVDAFNSNFGLIEFSIFEGTGTGGGSAYGRKQADSDWTVRYNFSSGASNYIYWQGGFTESGPTIDNSNMEDAYNVAVGTNGSQTAPGMVFNESEDITTNAYSYRNSVINTSQGVAQSTTTGNGPFTFSSNAVQWNNLAQAVLYDSGSGWVGGTPPSNVTLATPTQDAVCQASTGIFANVSATPGIGNNVLTGSCASSYLGQVGAQIQ